MKGATVQTIFRKEMLDTFRDRRTLIAMIGVPVLMYPALFILATQVTLIQRSRIAAQVSRVAVTGPSAGAVRGWFEDQDEIGLETPGDADAALTAGDVDVIVETTEALAGSLGDSGTGMIAVRFDAAETRSREALDRVRTLLKDNEQRIIAERVRAAGLADTFARPLQVDIENVAPPAKSTGSLLGMILPLIMVVMLGVGAFYPAVDLTAGEKERGTFETLLSTPATKMEIVSGKFLAVFSLSMLTGILNLVSMIATFMFQLAQILGQAGEGASEFAPVIEIPPYAAFTILAVLVPLAFFISSAMMTVALLAKSFREAQNYVSPFFIALVLPASASAIPGMELTRTTQFIPIANVSLLFRDLLTGSWSGEAAFFVILSTAVYALLALLLAAWMFQREDVVLSEESIAPFAFDRASIAPAPTPTPGMSLTIFAVVMLLIFYAGSAFQTWRLHAGLALTQYALILAPVLAALWYGKRGFRTSLNLRLPRLREAAATLLLAIGWVVVSIQIGFFAGRAIPVPEELTELSLKLFDTSALPGGTITLLLIVAVSPAICEEMLFRGVLVSGLRQRLSAGATVLVVGLLFGLFHLSIYKLVPTALSGIVFTYLVVRTGSIYLSMLTHLTLNGLSILVETGHLPAGILQRLENMDIEAHGLSWSWVAAGALAFVLGIAAIEWSVRRDRSENLRVD